MVTKGDGSDCKIQTRLLNVLRVKATNLELALCLQGLGDGFCCLHTHRVSLQPQSL